MKKRITALLLCLVMALSLVPATVWAADLETEGTDEGISVQAARDYDPLASHTIYNSQFVGNKNFSKSVSLNKNSEGNLQAMPLLNDIYNPTAYCAAKATSSNPNVVEVKTADNHQDIVVGQWVGGDWNGEDCLQVNVNAKNPGTATVTLTFYYTFSQSVNPFTNPNAKWFRGTMTFTVTVSDPDVQPAAPTKSDLDYFWFYDSNLQYNTQMAIVMWCHENMRGHYASFSRIYDVEDGYSFGEVIKNDGSNKNYPASQYPWMCVMSVDSAKYLDAYNYECTDDYGLHYLHPNWPQIKTVQWFYNDRNGWDYAYSGPIYIDITHDPSAATPTKPGDDTVKGILTGNIVEVYCTTEQKSNSYPLEAGTFDVSAPVKGSDGSYTCTVTLKDGADGVDKYITKAGTNHTADATQTAVTTVTLKSTNNGQTWTPDGSASFKLYAKCDNVQPPLDSEPTYEDLKPLFDKKIEVKDKIRTGYTDHGTEKFGLIKDSYGMTKDNNGQVTLTIKAEKYVATYNAKHAGHALVKDAAGFVQLTLEKASDKWSIAGGKTPVTFEVECNELTPPTEPEKTDFNDRNLVIECVTDAQNHSSETVPYSQGDYTIDWTEGNNTCTVTFMLDKYVAYYTAKHGKHTAVANQTVTKGFHFVNGAWVPDDTTFPEIKVQCETSNIPDEPTRDDIFKALNGLVTVTCINRVWKDGNKVMDCGESKYAAKAGIVGQNYTIKQDKNNANAWIVTFPVTNFVKALKQTPAHDLYSNNTLNWSITWTDEKWTAAPVEPGVDDLVKLTHAPTDWREVNKVTHNGIWTSCENGKTGKCEYGIAVAFAKGDVVSVVPEAGVPGSYIATFKVSTYADTCAKACNDKNFKNSSRTHDLLTQETVQWKLYATDQADEKIGNQVLNHVWAATPVTKDKDDVCQVAHRVKVTFDENYNNASTTEVMYKYNTNEVKEGRFPTNPTREGYTFKGWNTMADGTGTAFDTKTVVTADVIVYAKWEPTQYTITYDLRDSKASNNPANPVTYTVEDAVTLQAPTTKRNNQFLEWRDEKGNVITEIAAGTTGNVKVYAYWKCPIKLYELTANGKVQLGNTIYVTEGTSYPLPDGSTYAKNGYTFKCWYETEGNLTANKNQKTAVTPTVTKEWKLYGKNIPVEYTITYVLNDKDAKHTNQTTYTVEDEFAITDATNGSFGRKFLEWRAADSKTGKAVNKIEKGTTGSITLYAIWQNPVNYFQVDKDGNKTLIRTDYVTVHEDYQTIAAIDKAGYTFDGWYKSTKDFGADSKKVTSFTAANSKAEWKLYGKLTPNANTPYVVEHYQEQLDGTYKLVKTENLAGTTDTTVTAVAKSYTGFTYDETVKGTVKSGTIAGNGSLVLKLYYTRNSYTVTFQPNNGEAATTATVKYDGTVAKPTDPTKSGYTFGGWYTDNKCTKGNEFSFDTKITGNMTLYAKWDVKRTGTNPDAKNPYIKDNTTKTDGKKVESGNTFDAGISLYVGLGILSLTGSAAAIYKRREEY